MTSSAPPPLPTPPFFSYTMKLSTLAVSLFVAIGLASAPAIAAPAKKAAATKKAAAKKTTAKKTTGKKKAATPVVEAPTPARALDVSELALASRVQTGAISCELGTITVTADDANPGYFRVVSGKKSYHMHPVPTSSGALRLEDDKASAVWLQLGNKSMLMDQKLGQRVADGCATARQREVAAELERQPNRPSLFDTHLGR